LISKHIKIFNITTTMAHIADTKIPPDAHQYLLPLPDMSVMEFLKFRVPMIQPSTSFTKPEQYFLTGAPNTTIDLQDIQYLPIPSCTVVESLARSLAMSVNGTGTSGTQYQSIQCLHVSTTKGTQYPLWIIQYWVEIVSICSIRQIWLKADESLQKQSKLHHGTPTSDPKQKKLIQDVYNALSCIPWNRHIQGFSASVGTEYLAAYATTEWLNDEHITHMLDLLRCDVKQEGLSQRVEVESIWFLPKLKLGYGDQEKYASHRSYRWIRGQGQALSTGAREQLVLIGNIGGNHWISLVMDFAQGTVFYGDSMGMKISDGLREVLDWWTHLHSGRFFDYCDLPITLQQDDYSCGVLAWHALVAFIFKEKHAMVDPSCVAQERLKILLRVAEKHHEHMV
jgi:hypothetical protein